MDEWDMQKSEYQIDSLKKELLSYIKDDDSILDALAAYAVQIKSVRRKPFDDIPLQKNLQ